MPGGKPPSQTVRSDPWSGQQPYLRSGFQRAEEQLNAPGSTVAPMSPHTQAAIGQMTGPNPLIDSALNQAQQTISGDYFSGPGMDRMRDYVLSSVQPGVDAAFSSGGRFGSGLHGESLGRGVALGMTPFMDAERNRMMQATGMAPGLSQAGYAGNLAAGQLEQSQRQAELSEPQNRLAQYMNLVGGGGYGGTQTTTGGQRGNPLLGGLGGLTAGAGLASSLGPQGLGLMAAGSPWAWPMVLGGGLMGAFG